LVFGELEDYLVALNVADTFVVDFEVGLKEAPATYRKPAFVQFGNLADFLVVRRVDIQVFVQRRAVVAEVLGRVVFGLIGVRRCVLVAVRTFPAVVTFEITNPPLSQVHM
jgi:hypothetical protein